MVPIGLTLPFLPPEANTLLAGISILLIIIAIIGFLSKLGGAAYTLGKWFLLSLLILVMVWGLYNTIGSKLGLWQPLSLDQWLKPITEPLDAAVNWLWQKITALFGGMPK